MARGDDLLCPAVLIGVLRFAANIGHLAAAIVTCLLLCSSVTTVRAQGQPPQHLSFEHLQKLAVEGNADAQNLLGSLYERGAGVTQSFGEARKWYELAAKQGHAAAQSNLGAMHWAGKGSEKNAQEAVRLFKLSAAQDDAAGLNNLANAYAVGEGVARDPGEAIRLRRRAVERGSTQAAIVLANAYSSGYGVPKDQNSALQLYKFAAEKGHPYAQHIYARILDEGYYGLHKNPAEAFPWYLKAAYSGYSPAQVAVALALRDGRGVAKNQQEFREWIARAAADGDPHAIEIAKGQRVEPMPQSVKTLIGFAVAAAVVTWALNPGQEQPSSVISQEKECPFPTLPLNSWNTLCQHPFTGDIIWQW